MRKHRIYVPDGSAVGSGSHAIDEKRCRELVHHDWSWGQCSRKAKVFEQVDGERMGFCRMHSMEYREKVDARRSAKYEAERAERQRRAEKERLQELAFETIKRMSEERATAARLLSLWREIRAIE